MIGPAIKYDFYPVPTRRGQCWVNRAYLLGFYTLLGRGPHIGTCQKRPCRVSFEEFIPNYPIRTDGRPTRWTGFLGYEYPHKTYPGIKYTQEVVPKIAPDTGT